MNAPRPRRPAGPRRFRAPWSPLLRTVTAAATLILVGVSVALWIASDLPIGMRILTTVLLAGMLAACFACAIWGYEVSSTGIRVIRTGWVTTLPFASLEAVEFDPKATRGAWRLLGNGGLFVFAGLYWSRRNGRFRLLATDFTRSVVLRFNDRLMVVVTPEPPIEFVECVGRLAWPDRPSDPDPH